MSKILPLIITFVIAGAGGYFGGMQYQKSRRGQGDNRQAAFGNFQNMTSEQRAQLRTQFAGREGGLNGTRTGGVRQESGSIATGEILSKDDKSITVMLQDGGSKIIFYSDTTDVGKFDAGSADDLAVGANVFVNGTANDDGTLTAQNIQIRSAMFPNAVQ